MKVAIPSETDACLDSMRSGHFGHTPYFTVVEVDNGTVVSVEAVKNVDHDVVGCGGVIDFAISLGIDAMVTVGMGVPPLTRFNQAGIAVYTERMTPRVGDVLELFLADRLPLMSLDQACRH